MTSTVTVAHVAVLALFSTAFDPITTTVGLASLVALLLLLLLKEIVRVNAGHRGYAQLRAFDLVIAPLLLLFTIIVAARMVALLQA